MKVKKAVKRLTKIKALMSDVTKRFSVSAPHLREVLQGAEDAIARAKQAVSIESGTKATTAKARRSAKRATPAQKKASVKTVAANTSRAKAVKKSPRVKKAGKKRAAKKTTPRPAVEAATQVAVQ